jgi:hypothetical protein
MAVTAIDIESPGGSAASLRAALRDLRLVQPYGLFYVGTNLTTQNYTGAGQSLLFNSDAADEFNLHDTGSNTERATVPAGYSYARYSSNISLSLGAAGQAVSARVRRYNSSSVLQSLVGLGGEYNRWTNGANSQCNIKSAIIPVSSGDYFVTNIIVATDNSVTVVANESWAFLELWP